MGKSLASYSIETDSVVLLNYNDGSSKRVRLSRLPAGLTDEDKAKIRRAVQLRHDFIRRNLGSVSKLLAVALAVLIVGYGTAKAVQAVEHSRHHTSVSTTQPAPNNNSGTSSQATAPAQTQTTQPATTGLDVQPAVGQGAASTGGPTTDAINQAGSAAQAVTQQAQSLLQPVVAPAQQLLSPMVH